MILQIVSDIHAEFHKDLGISFIEELKKAGDADVLIIAGDLAPPKDAFRIVPACCDVWPKVILVLGNHEFYGSDRRTVLASFRKLEKEFPNLHVLDDQTVTMEGQRFVGSTLWFEDTPDARIRAGHFSDFGDIKGLGGWVWEANRKSKIFLRKTVRPDDVVITHHIPTSMGSASYWTGSFLQPFFVCPMDKVIVENRPKLWVYGHTHDSHDFTLCETRFICNPFGYANHPKLLPNPDFDWGKFVDV
jgi:Icc-related predicted phosphoesterase